MFQLNTLFSLTYQDFGQLLDASGDRLYKKIMLALGVETDKELAQKLGISEQAVNHAKRNGKIPDRWLMYVVCHSGLALPLLLTLNELEMGKALTDQNRYAFRLVPTTTSLQHLREEEYLHHVTSFLALQKHELHKAGAARDELVALVTNDHALEPTVRPGDTVIISLTQRHFIQGGIFLVQVDDILLLARLNKLPGRFRVSFDNIQVKDFELADIDIRGRVLWISKAL